MAHEIEGSTDGRERRIAIVCSRFNAFVTTKLLSGALLELARHGVDDDAVTIVHVPGGFEIPLAARRLAATKRFDAVICLGAVIRGATAHFDYVCSEAARGIARVSDDTGVPTLFGVLTVDSVEQALERAGTRSGNKGAEVARAALEMAGLLDAVDAMGTDR